MTTLRARRPARDGVPARGFTLLELLVALAILALLSVLGYRALAVAHRQRGAADRGNAALARRSISCSRASKPICARRCRATSRTGSATRAGVARRHRQRTATRELRFSRAGPEFALEAGSAGPAPRLSVARRRDRSAVLAVSRQRRRRSTPTAYALVDGVAALSARVPRPRRRAGATTGRRRRGRRCRARCASS